MTALLEKLHNQSTVLIFVAPAKSIFIGNSGLAIERQAWACLAWAALKS
jgi:hypothetical protein